MIFGLDQRVEGFEAQLHQLLLGPLANGELRVAQLFDQPGDLVIGGLLGDGIGPHGHRGSGARQHNTNRQYAQTPHR